MTICKTKMKFVNVNNDLKKVMTKPVTVKAFIT